MGYGGGFPFEYGGGPTEDEIIYEAMKRAVGVGGYAPNEDGIDGLWRWARASAIASINTFAERAVLQFFPQTMTDHLPLAEDYLGIIPPEGATDEQRRAEVRAKLTEQFLSDGPDLLVALRQIDPRFVFDDPPHEQTATTYLGKAFEPQDGSPTYGPRRSTGWPNYSTDFWVIVRLPLDPDNPVPTAVDDVVLGRARRMLNVLLPSWVDFKIVTSTGWVADVSPADFTATT
jgi:hypothetical protein